MNNTVYTQEEQTEIVRIAATLEGAAQADRQELAKLKQQRFKPEPQRPVKRIIDANVAPVAPDYSQLPRYDVSFNQYLQSQVEANNSILNKIYGTQPVARGAVAAVVLFFLWIVDVAALGGGNILGVLYLVVGILGAAGALPLGIAYNARYRSKYNQVSRQAEAHIQSTPRYIEAKQLADNNAEKASQAAIEVRKKEIEENEKLYANQVAEYQTKILPEYKAAKQKWKKLHDIKLQVIEQDLKDTEDKLSSLYLESKLISTHFREVPKLVWIYEEMSTSQHDFDAAVKLLNDDTTHQLLQQVIAHVSNMEYNMMQGMEAIYMELDALNLKAELTESMLEDISENLRKTRRNVIIGNVMNGYQNYRFRKEFEQFRTKFV